MTSRRWSDAAIVAFMATALIAAGVAVVAVVKAKSENSPVHLVLETPTATPGGPTAVPWEDLAAEPSAIPRPVVLSSISPTPTSIPTPTDIPARQCRGEDLIGEWEGDLEGATHPTSTYFALKNTSRDPCRLDGRPDVTFLGADGTDVSMQVSDTGACRRPCAGGILLPTVAGVFPPQDNYGITEGVAHFALSRPGYSQFFSTATPCPVRATTMVVRVPGSDASIDIHLKYWDSCSAYTVSPFEVVKPPPPPPPPPTTFAVHLVAPTTVIAGEPLRYLVELTNVSPKEVMLVQGYCPNYVQKLGTPFDPKIRALNCSGVVAPRQMVAFAMEIDLPPGELTGALDLDWSWHDTFAGSDHTIVDVVPAASSP